MSQEVKDHRIMTKGSAARRELIKGARFMYDSVTTTFGPKGQNVLVEKPFGRPLPTRDGVTVARETYSKIRSENMGAQLLLEASENTNRIAGDGTTATVALAYHLLKNGEQLITAGVNPMEVKDLFINDSDTILEELNKIAKPVKKAQLKEVATVSSGDPLLGQLIAEAVDYVGENGGIMTEKAPVEEVEREYVDGYYLQQGFSALPTGKKELVDPLVLVLEKRITSSADIAELLTKSLQAKDFDPQSGGIPRFLIIGNIEEAAYFQIVNLINSGKLDAVVIKTPPQFGEMGRELLADIAIYANCKVFTEADNLNNFVINDPQKYEPASSPFVGSISKVVATHSESTIFADNSTEGVEMRVQELKDRLENEVSDNVAEKIRDRIAKLEGKIALFRIGGATDSEKEEKEFRVEDSINATRAAQRHGVVPGGASTLLWLSKCNISQPYSQALQSVFKKLLRNAALPAQVKLQEALQAPHGYGFNLRESDDLVDLVKAGVLDPKLVVSEVIKNATSVAHIALTTGVLLNFEDRPEK